MNDAKQQFMLHHEIYIPPTPAGTEYHKLSTRMHELWPQMSAAEQFAFSYRGDLNTQAQQDYFKKAVDTLIKQGKQP